MSTNTMGKKKKRVRHGGYALLERLDGASTCCWPGDTWGRLVGAWWGSVGPEWAWVGAGHPGPCYLSADLSRFLNC